MASLPSTLPLEILHHILSLAFLPSTPLYSLSSPDGPPPLHLLLVSHSIRQICLPFFWRIVTIFRPQDWITLFDKHTGLLVVGEEGKRRWACVHELRVGSTKVPVRSGLLMEDEDEDVLHRLRIPDSKQLPLLSFLNPPSLSLNESWGLNTSDSLFEHLNTHSPLALPSLKQTLLTQHNSLPSSILSDEVRISIKLAILLSRTTFFVYLLARTTPLLLSSSLALLRSLRLSRIGSPLGYSAEYGNLAPTLVLVHDPEDPSERSEAWKGEGLKQGEHTMTPGEFSMFWTSQRVIRGMNVRLMGFERVVGEDLRWWLRESEEIRRKGGKGREVDQGGEEGRWEWVDPKGDGETREVFWGGGEEESGE